MTSIPEKLRRLVRERAGNCCEYCLLSQEDSGFPYHAEHIRSRRHKGETEQNNLCWSCPDCNTFKGTDIGSIDDETDQFVRLFNPRSQKWADYFRLNGALIEALTPEGRVTVFLLRLNRPQHLMAREPLIRLGRYPRLDAQLKIKD